MGKSLQFSLLLTSILVLIVVLYFVIKKRINIHYSMIWIVWGVAMILISAFPSIFYSITRVLGIEVVSNAVFLIAIFFVYCLTFYLYLTISKHNEEIVKMNYEIAALKKKVEELENKVK